MFSYYGIFGLKPALNFNQKGKQNIVHILQMIVKFDHILKLLHMGQFYDE